MGSELAILLGLGLQVELEETLQTLVPRPRLPLKASRSSPKSLGSVCDGEVQLMPGSCSAKVAQLLSQGARPGQNANVEAPAGILPQGVQRCCAGRFGVQVLFEDSSPLAFVRAKSAPRHCSHIQFRAPDICRRKLRSGETLAAHLDAVDDADIMLSSSASDS